MRTASRSSVSTPLCSAVMTVTPTLTFGSRRRSWLSSGAGDFADVARAAKFHGGRNGADNAGPDAAGQGVPGDFDFLSGGEAADIGLVDECAHQHVGKIAFLQQKVSGLHVGARLDGERIDDAVKGSAHAGLPESIFGRFIGSLRLCCLRLNPATSGWE